MFARVVRDFSLEFSFVAVSRFRGATSAGGDSHDALAAELGAIRDEIVSLAGDMAGVDASIAARDGALESVTAALEEIGVPAGRIESAQSCPTDNVHSLRAGPGQVEDIDLAEALTELKLRETVFRAALGAFSLAGQPSLSDFLQ